MTSDPTVTTYTYWHVVAHGVRGHDPSDDWLEDRDHAARLQAILDADSPHLAPHRVVRVDVTITDPAPEQEGQG